MDTSLPEISLDSAPKVVFRCGPLRGHVLALEKDRTSIGRDPRNDISIRDDIVSSFHAAIIRDQGAFFLEDGGSKNGTFLNGERVQRAELKDGDVFCLCQSGPELQFSLGKPALPTLLESTTATFARTRSFSRALRELLPGRRSGSTGLISLTGVRRILDYRLEEATRRSRLLFLGIAGCFLVLSTAALIATVILGRAPADRAGRQDEGAVAKPVARLDLRLEPIYGSLFLSYREAPIGEAVVTNLGDEVLDGVELGIRFEGAASSFLVEPFAASIPRTAPGASARVHILPKLSTGVLSTQTREVTATATLARGGEILQAASRAVFVHGRNTFNWEEPARIAAFVDQGDPAVRELVNEVWRRRPSTHREEFPPPRVVSALTLLTGLANLGLSYRTDPANPISRRIDEKAIDQVNYPGETILAQSGDCDDLTVLCCSVLEAAGIPTAFVVGSGHVFLLFDTGIGVETLPQAPLDPGTVVALREKVWMPIEATALATPEASFAGAWAAAYPRCEAIASGEVKVVELKEAWRAYQPMNPPPDAAAAARCSRTIAGAAEGLGDRVRSALEGVRRLFKENLSKRIAEAVKGTEEGPSRDQAIGLLYARSGLFDEARRVLERAVFGDGGPPESGLEEWGRTLREDAAILLADLALCVTLGSRSPRDLDAAARYGEIAAEAFPPEPAREKGELMLRVALVHRLRGDLSSERSWSSRALGLDPGLEEAYRRLTASEGAVSGPAEEILHYLKRGLR